MVCMMENVAAMLANNYWKMQQAEVHVDIVEIAHESDKFDVQFRSLLKFLTFDRFAGEAWSCYNVNLLHHPCMETQNIGRKGTEDTPTCHQMVLTL